MPPIEANRSIALDDRLKSIAGNDSLRGDLMIPSVEGDVEYDSDEFHTGRYRNDHTQARRNALEAMGIKTVSATWGQVHDATRFDDFMWLVEKRFGLKHRTYSITQKSRQHDLHDFLIDTRRSKFKA